MTDLPHIIIAGQFPPPVTGFAFITQELARVVGERYQVTRVDLSPHRKRGGLFYHLQRLMLTLAGVTPLLLRATAKNRVFYVACESRLGLVYTIMLTAVARALGYRIYIHHHNFNYIDAHSGLMAVLVNIAGKNTTHIFLCEAMKLQFSARYAKSFCSVIISNSAFVLLPDKPFTPKKKAGDKLVIGLLSNLNNDKGLGLFLDVLRAGDVRGVLAGPPDGEKERAVIESACSELGTKLDYRGALYGEAKHQFFDDIDLFVFPTRYANEAQPTVIYEALASGVPVISYDRGCILSQVGSCGAVQMRDGEFVPFAIEAIETYCDHDVLSKRSAEAFAMFHADRKQALLKVQTLFGTHE